MEKLIKPVLIGGAAGALFMALFSAAVTMSDVAAEDQPARQIVAAAANVLFPPSAVESQLLKLDDTEYLVTAEPGYSLTASATSTVRKIGYGESRMVTISTTTSGVYSSDGLVSPHFRYPGIEVERQDAAVGAIDDAAETLAAWSPRRGWVATPTVSADSFAVVTRDGAITIINGTAGSCVIGPTIALC